MIAFDANMLSVALCANISVAVDPVTKNEIERPKERVDLLLADLDSRGERILIPTPALAEFLVLVGNSGAQYLEAIHAAHRFEIGEFTERAAIEAAQAIKKALDARRVDLTPKENGAKKRDGVEATWAKVNFDRQIVAIAKARPCSAIYSTDEHVAKHAEKMKIECIHLADLPLPPDPPQMKLELREPNASEDETTALPASIKPQGGGSRPTEDQAGTTDGAPGQDAGGKRGASEETTTKEIGQIDPPGSPESQMPAG